MDRLDRIQVEINASEDTGTGFITLDPSRKKNPKRPRIEVSRGKVQEMQRIQVFGNDSPFWLAAVPLHQPPGLDGGENRDLNGPKIDVRRDACHRPGPKVRKQGHPGP